MEQEKLKPTADEKIREVVEVIDLIIDGLGRTRDSYYYQSARERLKKLKEAL